MAPNRPWRYLLFAAAMVAVDQAIKLAVKLNMHIGEEIPVMGEWFKLLFVENKGAAFGLTLSGLFGGSDDAAKLLLSAISLALAGFILWYLFKVAKQGGALPWLIALVFGGAMGNIVDRLFYGTWFSDINEYVGGFLHGRVVDMFYVDPFTGQLPEWMGGAYYSMPIWNFADACITVGILLILIFQKRLFKEEPKPASAAPQPETATEAQEAQAG